MKKVALALTALAFLQAQELEVEGNLKVQGNIDASNQRVTNVGIPTDLTDAVNTEFLQNALRDDGDYEYKILYIIITPASNSSGSYIHSGSAWIDLDDIAENSNFNNDIGAFVDQFNNLLNEGWYLESINDSWWIFKRPLSE